MNTPLFAKGSIVQTARPCQIGLIYVPGGVRCEVIGSSESLGRALVHVRRLDTGEAFVLWPGEIEPTKEDTNEGTTAKI